MLVSTQVAPRNAGAPVSGVAGVLGAPETSYIQVKKNSSASWHGRYHSYIYWKMEKKKEKEKETLALAPFI
jgi:gas vesicle protein